MKKYFIVFSIVSMLLLSACSSDSPVAKELSEVLSNMHDAEKDFRTSQKKLSEIEKTEQVSFDEAMELTQTEDAELATNVEELEELLEKRVELINDEETSMELAGFFIPEVEKTMKNEDEDFVQLVRKRHELNEEFITVYRLLIDGQRELYTMLLDEEIEYKQLQEQVAQINEQNKIVHDVIKQFNKSTVEMNERKDAVFKSMKSKK